MRFRRSLNEQEIVRLVCSAGLDISIRVDGHPPSDRDSCQHAVADFGSTENSKYFVFVLGRIRPWPFGNYSSFLRPITAVSPKPILDFWAGRIAGVSSETLLAGLRCSYRRGPVAGCCLAANKITFPRLCGALSQFRHALRRFFRSADSLVRAFLPQHWQLADKAVRAPLVAASPRCIFVFNFLPPLSSLASPVSRRPRGFPDRNARARPHA